MKKIEKVTKNINENTQNGYVIKDFAPDARYGSNDKYFVYQQSSGGFQNPGTYGKLVYKAKTLKEIENVDFSQWED